VGAPRSPQGRRPHLLDVNGGIIGGRLQFEWTYSAHCHRQATIEKVAEDFRDALRRLITHCQEAQTVSYTPSDFPDVALDEDEITALLEEIS
jgi:non-ribosomal peptide synthase protein (TIGR01720 family)